MTRAVVMVDGEHYPPVVRDALAELAYDVVAAVLVGGTEKLRGHPDYGVPLSVSLESAVSEHAPDVVFDLSDEPVLGPVERMALASRALALGVPYEGADFRFDPPVFEPFGLPSIAVIGTGKRVGKTAVTGQLVRALARDRSVVVVAMGRGGPREPELIETPPSVDDLLALARAGRHAASDHLETAAVVGVPTVGCRRAGGGFAGAVAVSNVLEGASVAAGLRPDLVVFDGSGAALPPIAVGARVLVVGAHQDPAVATGYLNAYRHRLADLVILTSADDEQSRERLRASSAALVRDDVRVIAALLRPRPLSPVVGRRVAFFGAAPANAHGAIATHLHDVHGADDEQSRERLRASSAALVRDDVRVIAALLRPRPLSPVAGRRVAFFGAAPANAHGAIATHLHDVHGADVVAVSGALADRASLRAELSRVEAEVFLVELKAAAIDVVAEEALARGAEIVLVANDVVPLAGEPSLEAEFARLAGAAAAAALEAV